MGNKDQQPESKPVYVTTHLGETVRLIPFDGNESRFFNDIYKLRCNGHENVNAVADMLKRLDSFKGKFITVRALRDNRDEYKVVGKFDAFFGRDDNEYPNLPLGPLLWERDQENDVVFGPYFDRFISAYPF